MPDWDTHFATSEDPAGWPSNPVESPDLPPVTEPFGTEVSDVPEPEHEAEPAPVDPEV